MFLFSKRSNPCKIRLVIVLKNIQRLFPWLIVLSLAACSPADRDAMSLLNAGVKRFEQKDYDTAYGYFQRSVELNPHNASAFYHLGLVDLHARKDLGSARKNLEKSHSLDPKQKDVLLNLGRLALEESKPDEALKHLEAAIVLDANFYLAWYFKGVAAEGQGRFDDADVAWREAVAIQPDDARGFLKLAELYLRFESFGAAEAVYREGLRHNAGHSDLLEGLGLRLAERGQAKEAIKTFKEVLTRSPQRETSLYNLAFAYLQNDQPGEAVGYLRTYLDRTAHKRGHEQRAARALLEVVETHVQ